MQTIFSGLFIRLSFLLLFFSVHLAAQIKCVQCFQQNSRVSPTSTNLVLNGGFETSTCTPNNPTFCPNATSYNCDLANWTCSGGGSATYAMIFNNLGSYIVEGSVACYLGNYFCQPCNSTVDDTSCIQFMACGANGFPSGYPNNTAQYGGATGVKLEQTVTGLIPGACYVIEFWAGGEDFFAQRGVFGLDVGFGDTMLYCKATEPSGPDTIGTRYMVIFNAIGTTQTIRFTNWGHICSNCTEVILDDVRLYPLGELPSTVNTCNAVCEPPPCTLADSVTHMPNIFTPNGDGKNDRIRQNFYCDVTFTLYSRWGNKVYEYKGTSLSWDGTADGKPVSDGVYYYVIRSEANEAHGYIHVMR